MQLPNFLDFEAFNQLREKMGAEALGHFDFFDPNLHLSTEERERLQTGLLISIDQIAELADRTLGFKNGRVLVSVVQPTALQDWVFHLAACAQLQALRGEVRATMAEPHHPGGQFQVCGQCLQVLSYKGFDALRNRHRHYSLCLQEEFNLPEFFQAFPPYPLSAKLLRQNDFHQNYFYRKYFP